MTDRTFTIVGRSTQGRITKFRVANGSVADRVKILERNGCTDVHFIELPAPMDKMTAIEAYKAQHPESANIRMPNEKEVKPAKTITVKRNAKGRKDSTDAAAELLKAVEQV